MTFRRKWVWLTSAGWITGIAGALVAAPLLNAVTGNYLQQTPLAVSLALFISFFQYLALRKLVNRSGIWVAIYLISFTLCFSVIESISDLWHVKPEVYMPLSTVIAAALAGILQGKYFLRLGAHGIKSWAWHTMLAWTITIAPIFSLPGLMHYSHSKGAMFVTTLLIFCGGPILGLMTRRISAFIHPNSLS